MGVRATVPRVQSNWSADGRCARACGEVVRGVFTWLVGGPDRDVLATPDHDPLSGIDGVPWERLHHAYGPAVDVPGQLRALRSPEAQVRAHAQRKLRGNVYHQGTRWQASCHVVPFLVALVADAGTADRAAVMVLLRAVSIGDLRDSQLPLDVDREFAAAANATDDDVALLVAVLYDEQRDLDEVPDGVDVAVDARWRQEAYQAAASHIGTYCRLLADPDVEVAARAAELLAWFPPGDAALQALVGVPADRQRSLVRASANLTLAYLGRDDTGIDSQLLEQMASELAVVRRTAAVALAYRMPRGPLPEVAVDALTEPVAAGSIPALPGWDRPVDGFVALALRHANGLLS